MAPSNAEGNKRQRWSAPNPEDFLYYARLIWSNDSLLFHRKKGTVQSEERMFRQYFGCGILVCLNLWCALVESDSVPVSGTMSHLLWTLMFLRVYAKERVLCTLAGGVNRNTFSKWTWLFIDAIVRLESQVVSLPTVVFVCFCFII